MLDANEGGDDDADNRDVTLENCTELVASLGQMQGVCVPSM